MRIVQRLLLALLLLLFSGAPALAQGAVARQVRVRCLRRGTEFGYSIRRLEIY